MAKAITDNLKLHCLALQLNCTNLEVNTDGTNITLGVCIVRETQKQAGLRTTQNSSRWNWYDWELD